jgi:hypothetical protein
MGPAHAERLRSIGFGDPEVGERVGDDFAGDARDFSFTRG